MDARLIFDEPARGSWNMAVDEALLRAANDVAEFGRRAEESCDVVLRFYQWKEPTLSLGYFQSSADRTSADELPVVRRSTGGGAIVHDRELTYSLVHPIQDRFSDESQCLIRRIHGAIITALRNEFGVEASLCDRAVSRSPEPFLCFARRAELDVLLADHKIVGSAQRRYRRAVLQHGSILLAKSPHAAMLPGIGEICRNSLACKNVADVLSRQVAADLRLVLVNSQLAPAEAALAADIERDRFANHEWTTRR